MSTVSCALTNETYVAVVLPPLSMEYDMQASAACSWKDKPRKSIKYKKLATAQFEFHFSLPYIRPCYFVLFILPKALCGRMGGKIRSEYAMVGDVINLAARLMGKAKGRIVCDEVTHDLVSHPKWRARCNQFQTWCIDK